MRRITNIKPASMLVRTMITGMLLFSSCLKETIDNVLLPDKWSPDVAFPIGRATLTVNNYFYNYNTSNPISDSLSVYFNGTKYLVDSSDLDMAELLPFALTSFTKNPENIKKLMFRCNVDNGYPSNAMVQIYVLDAGNAILDSVLQGSDRYLVPGTLINDTSIQPAHFQRDIYFTTEQIGKIQNVANIRVKTGLFISSGGLDTVKLFPQYDIKVQVGVRLALDVNPDSAINTYQSY